MLRYVLDNSRLMFRVLLFRATTAELDNLGWRNLPYALPIVWLVGYGRWWDDPNPLSLLHRSGLGSVVYVFVLAGLLWIASLPLRERTLTYPKMLAFVSLTALPGALYAIPVETFMTNDMAIRMNIIFLSIVSVYRVALLFWFQMRGIGMGAYAAFLATFMPISLIGIGLVFFGLVEGILDIMGGFRESGAIAAYEFVAGLSCLFTWGAPVLIILWVIAGTRRRPAFAPEDD